MAGYRLALLMARSGKPGEMDQAVAILDRLIGSSAGTRRVQAMPRQTAGLRELLSKQPAGDTLAVDAEAAVTEARKLRELLVNNRDPHQDDKALRELLRLTDYLHQQRRQFADFPSDAELVAPAALPANTTVVDAAAWTSVARVLMNLDEFITRE